MKQREGKPRKNSKGSQKGGGSRRTQQKGREREGRELRSNVNALYPVALVPKSEDAMTR